MAAKKRIIILGGGFGGAYCALELEKRLHRGEAEVVLVNRHDYLLFYPLLVEAGTGGAETRHAAVALRSFIRLTTFRMGDVLAIDTARRNVRIRLGREGPVEDLTYDHLIFALGSVSSLPDVPGLRDFGFEMKSLTDAAVLRDRAIELLETADGVPDAAERRALLHFVVVGGNFTGIEVAGQFNSLLRRAKRRYPNVHPSDIRVTVLNRGTRLLKELDVDLAAYAAKTLRHYGVHFLFGTTTKEIFRDRAVLTNGKTLSTHTVIWCAGIAPNPIIKKTTLPTDDKGYILCEPDLRVRGFDDVWAIGDVAVNVDPSGHKYPETAQHAVKEGVWAAQNIVRALRGKKAKPCKIKSLGALAMIGHHTGVAKIFNVTFSGLLAWFLYRTIYLVKIPGLRRKIRIAIDWTLDILLPRDIMQLGIRQPENSPARAPSDSAPRNGSEKTASALR